MASFKQLFAPKDMTIGAPWKRIMEFAVPMLIGNIAQQLYNTVDSVIVGQYVGDNALAAVGSAGMIFGMMLALFVGIATGAGIMVSQYFGAKDRERLSRTIGNCITLTVIASLIIMIIGPLITYPMLRLIGTPESIIDWCAGYLKIFFYGIAGFFVYNILNGILRGLGDSISALIYLLITTALNIGLDLWFVAGLNMGVFGVALATIIAQSIAAVLVIIKILRMKDVFDISWTLLKPKKEYVLNIIKLGIPSGLNQMIFAVAGLVVQRLTNSFGEIVIACNVVVMRVDSFAVFPNMSFGMAMSTFSGQNVGARKMNRVHQGVKQGTMIAVGVAAVMTTCILIFGRSLISIFTDTQELIDMGVTCFKIIAFGYICMAVTQCLMGVIRGAGDTITPMWISLINMVIVRIPLAYLLAHLSRTPENPVGDWRVLFYSLIICFVLGSVLTVIFYRFGKWRNKGPIEIK